jgi:phage terminase large subunit-like protein
VKDQLERLDPDRYDPVRTKSDRIAEGMGYVWDKEKALYVQGFIEDMCKLYVGEWAGQPIRLFGYQQEFIWQVYGWVDKDTGLRRFKEAYWEIAKKNAKSPTIAALSLYHLIADGENAPEIYINAATRFQTKPVYKTVSLMIAQDEELKEMLELRPGTNEIRYPAKNGTIIANSADSDSKDGLQSSFTIFDELHRQPDRRLWDVFRYAGKSRRQPLLMSITTAGEPRDDHPCFIQHNKALAVEAGTREDVRFLGIVHAPRGKNSEIDVNDRRVWRMANPAMKRFKGDPLGIFSEEDFAADLEDAKREGPAALANFKRLQLNVWQKLADLWIDMQVWHGQRAGRTDEEIEAAGDLWAAGLDMSAGGDLTAYVRVAGNVKNGIDVRSWFWIPEATAVQRQNEEGIPYLEYAERGLVRLIPGATIDESVIRDFILKDAEALRGKLRRIHSDKYHSREVGEACILAGLDFRWFNQRPLEFTRPLKVIENMLARGVLSHADHAILNYCASNVAVWTTEANENRMFNKGRSGGRIDGMVAMAEALAGLMDVIGYDGDGGEEAAKPKPVASGKVVWL